MCVPVLWISHRNRYEGHVFIVRQKLPGYIHLLDNLYLRHLGEALSRFPVEST